MFHHKDFGLVPILQLYLSILVNKSTKCGCFYCGKIFEASEVIEWVIDRNGDTALCPYCMIDSVLPDSAGYPLSEEFLVRMRDMLPPLNA